MSLSLIVSCVQYLSFGSVRCEAEVRKGLMVLVHRPSSRRLIRYKNDGVVSVAQVLDVGNSRKDLVDWL